MYIDFLLSKENLDIYLAELGKQFRKLYRKNAKAEIILIGGAAVLINYNFRNSSTDADAIIQADASMKEAINFVRDKYNLPSSWLNEDFKNTKSYSDKLRGVSVPYRIFSNVVHIRTIAAEYLIAMKLMSGRQYKFDLSDIIGVLWEHEKIGKSIDRETIDKAFIELYGQQLMPDVSKQLLDDVFNNRDYENIYAKVRETEKQTNEMLLNFRQDYPNILNEDNINEIIEQAKRKKK